MRDKTVRFALIAEGPSDKALVKHLQVLLIHCGAMEAVGAALARSEIRSPGSASKTAIGGKVNALLSVDSEYDLLFVHRDTDNVDYEVRLAEIETAMAEVRSGPRWIPAIPVRETEAWLLLDEKAIRRVAGNPNGTNALDLPRPGRIERVARPKELLADVLSTASGRRGNRLRKFKRKFPQHRRILLEQLPAGGGLEQVPAWRRLKRAVEEFVNGSSGSCR